MEGQAWALLKKAMLAFPRANAYLPLWEPPTWAPTLGWVTAGK